MAHVAPFVGREGDVARLVDWAAGSTTPAALVLGEPGAGKSRLVQELVDRAGPGGPRFCLCRATAVQPPVLRQLVRAAAPGPTVLVVEDLHWLGSDGLDVLDEVLRASVDGLRVLATAREGEPPVERWVARAVRDGVLEVLPLRGLRVGDVAVLLEEHLGRRPSRDEVERIARLSGGNPRWVEELARHEAAGGGDRLPPQLVDVVTEQWRDLSPQARDAVQAVSVAGGDVPHSLLAAVVPDLQLGQGCREAVESGVLEVTGDGRGYRFRSELARAACDQGLLPAEREALHRRYAAALTGAADHDLDELVELARHWVAAGDQERGLHWSLVAAQEAERRAVHGQALASYQEALALWTAGTRHGRVDVLGRAARVAGLAGERDTGLRLVEQALALVDPVAEPVVAAGLEERRAWLLGAADATTGRRAVDLVAAGTASRERARVLATHSLLLVLRGRPAEAQRPAEEALAVARRLGAVAEQAAALVSLGTARALSTDRVGGDRVLRQGCELARSVDDGEDLPVAYQLLLETRLLLDADLTSVVQLAAVAGEALRRLGVDTRGTRLCAAAAHSELGQWGLAAQEARAAARSPDARLLLALAAAGRGDPAPDLRESGLAEGGFTLPGLSVLLHGSWLAELQLLQGAATDAADTVGCALMQLAATAESGWSGPLLVLGMRAQADRATAGWDTGDGALVRDAQEQGEALARRAAFGSGSVGQALSASWAGERSRLAGGSDPGAWAAAAQAWLALSRLPRAAYARWRQAEALLVDRAHRRDAGPVALEALDLADRLGAAPLRRQLELLARQAHLPLPRAEPEPEPATGPTLTRREQDVLELLAEGLSNRAIAAALVVSPKTVDTHVAHLLMKLDVHDRVAAAGRAQRLGILRR